MDKKQLIIFDGNALIHRAFHALPPLTTKKGELINAVYGFLLVFLRTLREFKPEFIAVAFDFPGPTFRQLGKNLLRFFPEIA
jgi:DNA polymerase-1